MDAPTKTVDYQIQLMRNSDVGWIPIQPQGNSYKQTERWYTDLGEAGKNAQRIRERLTWAEVRVVRRTTVVEEVRGA